MLVAVSVLDYFWYFRSLKTANICDTHYKESTTGKSLPNVQEIIEKWKPWLLQQFDGKACGLQQVADKSFACASRVPPVKVLKSASLFCAVVCWDHR